ncbi:hypothetical protein KC332_g7552 [Hortaea werneckii]|nr:hypothetical protein KC358_g7238 [Hortaea werneckii]KAI6830777.1 hypothetical protein KC350_g7489 [Hortaea werneckii]KAI6929943.1 hypothetical protein KC348_g7700 [Hortaea werneckii]KAI6933928.1 hypothetical protein KC341_g7948 [Hortaea werneckii]KAI6962301.1 hypothetical protein KC321_g11842 [Hortaea werneckii]
MVLAQQQGGVVVPKIQDEEGKEDDKPHQDDEREEADGSGEDHECSDSPEAEESRRHEISSLRKSHNSQAEELGRVHQQLAGSKVSLDVRDNEIVGEQDRLQIVRRVRDMATQRTKAMAAQHANHTSSLEQRLKDGESDMTQLVATMEELNRKL